MTTRQHPVQARRLASPVQARLFYSTVSSHHPVQAAALFLYYPLHPCARPSSSTTPYTRAGAALFLYYPLQARRHTRAGAALFLYYPLHPCRRGALPLLPLTPVQARRSSSRRRRARGSRGSRSASTAAASSHQPRACSAGTSYGYSRAARHWCSRGPASTVIPPARCVLCGRRCIWRLRVY